MAAVKSWLLSLFSHIRLVAVFVGELFDKHMLARRLSFFAAWFTLIYCLVYTMQSLAIINEHAATVLLRLIEVSAAVVLFYHYRRDKS